MSASLRKFRALVYEYADAGTDGAVDSIYRRVPSSAADEHWWCSRVTPTGREVTTGMKPEHRIDVVLGFSAYVPVEPNSAVVLYDLTDAEEAYIVRAVLSRDYGRDEVQVYAERVADLILTP